MEVDLRLGTCVLHCSATPLTVPILIHLFTLSSITPLPFYFSDHILPLPLHFPLFLLTLKGGSQVSSFTISPILLLKYCSSIGTFSLYFFFFSDFLIPSTFFLTSLVNRTYSMIFPLPSLNTFSLLWVSKILANSLTTLP